MQKINLFTYLLLFVVSFTNAQIIHENNFNSSTNWDAGYHFNYKDNFTLKDTGGYDNSGYVQIKVNKDQHYGGSLKYIFADNGLEDPQELYAQYKILYEPSMGRYGGKSPGFDGTRGVCGWGNCVSDGTNGWSARGSLSDNDTDGLNNKYYVYHKDMSLANGKTWGDSWHWEGPGAEMEFNRWYHVEQYIKVNDADSSNGILRAWIDSVLVFEKTGIRFTTTSNNNFDKVYAYWFNYYHGGSAVSPQDAYVRIDDFVLSTSHSGKVIPTIEIASPKNGAFIKLGDTVTVTTATEGNFQELYIEVDSNLYASDNSYPYSFSIADLTVGTHNLFVYGKLEDNSIVNSQNIEITVGEVLNSYTETFEKITLDEAWGEETYTGDYGFEWTINAKGTSGWIDSTKCIYMVCYDKKQTIGVSSGTIPNGIGSFSVQCKDLWNTGIERTIELIIDGRVVSSQKHSGTEVYTFTVDNINKPGDFTIAINNATPLLDEENNSIALDNITWTTYDGPANAKPLISDQSFSIKENSINGSSVGTIVASDPDTDQTITYSIVEGNASGTFEINSESGELKVLDNSLLDYETNSEITIKVKVEDSGMFSENSTATITINIEDVIDTNVEDNYTTSINIYPNPFSTSLHLNVENYKKATLIDFSGQVIIQKDIQNKNFVSFSPSYSEAPAGLYIVHLVSDNEVKQIKVIRK